MRSIIRAIQAVLLCAVAGSLPATALAGHYEIVTGEGTEIVFQSRAPMEKFEGKTGQVTGWLEADLAALDQSIQLEVRVDLASFDTGLGRRNKHMRQNHLETDQYPVATFTGGQISGTSGAALSVGGTVDLVLSGTLDLHGVVREMSCTVTLTRPTADELQVEAHFVVELPDYQIKRPKFLIMKLAVDQHVAAKIRLQKEPGS